MCRVTTDGRDWARLADRLISRSAELRYGGKRRAAFARDHGLSHTRTIDDLENARRTNYEDATLADVERIYRWKPGSIKAVLAGGEPTPIPDASGGADGGPADLITEWEKRSIAEIETANVPQVVKDELMAVVRTRAAEARIAEDRIRNAAAS